VFTTDNLRDFAGGSVLLGGHFALRQVKRPISTSHCVGDGAAPDNMAQQNASHTTNASISRQSLAWDRGALYCSPKTPTTARTLAGSVSSLRSGEISGLAITPVVSPQKAFAR